MKLFLIFIGVFFLVAVVMAFLPIQVQFRYLRDDQNDELVVAFSFLKGLLQYKVELPAIDLGSRLAQPFVKVKMETEGKEGLPITKDRERFKLPKIDMVMALARKILLHVIKYKPVIRYIKQHTRFHKLKCHTELGLGDPAVTGLAVGLAWSMQGFLLSFFQHNFLLGDYRPELTVIPNFRQAKLRLDINCIFDIKIGHIITAMIILARKFFTVKGV